VASPQCENGFIRIAKELARALMRTNLSAYQYRLLWALWCKTYGWNKKEDWISNSQLVEMTGLPKGHVSRAKKELLMRNIIVTHPGNKLAFNKDYTQWRELPKGVRGYGVTHSGKSSSHRVIGVTPSGGDKRKEYEQKKTSVGLGCIRCIYDFYCKTMEKDPSQYVFTKKKADKIRARLKDCTVSEIRNAIMACRESLFHMGQNDNRTAHNDLFRNIIRDREKVEWWNERTRILHSRYF